MTKAEKLIYPESERTNEQRRNETTEVPVHESITSLPPLDSAPPSGNFASFSDHPLSSVILPPPPPPPPPRLSTVHQVPPPPTMMTAVSALTMPRSPSVLPPPPRVSPMPSTTSTAKLSASTGISGSPTFPSVSPPPLPPPPPPSKAVPEPVLHFPTSPPPFLPLTTFAPSPNHMILAQRQTHIPILVIATEAANQLAWKNSLQLIDLFQGIVHDLKLQPNNSMTPFRSVSRSLFPTEIKVRFVEPSQMEPLSYQAAHDVLHDNAKIQAADGNVDQDLVLLEDRVDELLQDRNQDETLQAATKDAYQLTSPLDIPWMVRYRLALDVSTNALPQDLINCPPLILLVCTTNEIETPDQVLQELRNSPHILPEPYKNGLYDPQTMRHEVMVLHDAVHGPPGIDDQVLRQSLQRQFGPNAAVLRINSVLPEMAVALADQEVQDLWGGKGQLGNYLSVNDRVLLRRYFQSIFTTALLPAMERRISDLNTIVNERKKGVRNLVKAFWRKPKDENNPSSGSNLGTTGGNALGGEDGEDTVKYRYDTVESQTRLLADTLFLMQDWDAALSTYRLIRDDYKSDKALAYYASVQEMMALCIYQMDPYSRNKEIFSHLETALLSYTRAAEEERARASKDSTTRPSTATHATRLATRLCLILAAASDPLTKNREVEVADLLASASSHESNLGAAVLLEQSSSFFYVAGMFRKYAFHILMSGHMFRTGGQDHHAFRCFTSALYVYRNGGWGELHNHLRSALAAQLYTMGRMSVALILYAKLIGSGTSGKVSAKSQQKFLQHLVEICEDHRKAALAGADRMAPPPDVKRSEREEYRNARLEKIVNIIRYNRTASRVLELPNVDLPKIEDRSVRTWTHAEQHFADREGVIGEEKQAESPSTDEFGKSAKGDQNIWQEMELMAISELRAVAGDKPQLDETVTAALAKISNRDHRKVIAEVDKEIQNRNIAERSKKYGTQKPGPIVRAKGEPIFCEFVIKNPLAVDVQVTQVQLVVKMIDTNGKTCTNELGIEMREETGPESKQSWTFASTSGLPFTVPSFCRISEPDTRVCTPASPSPFFVVTKHEVILPAGGETQISLGLTPLVEGELEIIGVRSKLMDKIWVYHPFKIPGPFLKDTRTNIMNRVRGESILLKAKVECDMPCLSVDLVRRISPDSSVVTSDGGPLLEGQLSSWTIQLRNVGTAPASAITLKTNLPWIKQIQQNHDLQESAMEAKATSHCVGPTGTMMELPISNGLGLIRPGETVEVPVQIRTSGSKKQGFYMLYRYELHDPNTTSKHRSRWLRKMYEVPVYPSLDVTAKSLAASLHGKDILISVEMTNNRLDRPTDLFITLDKLGLTSRHYRLEALPGQFTTNVEFGNVLQIGWQERVTVLYRVIQIASGDNRIRLSECAFSQACECSLKECNDSDLIGYLCLEQAFESFEFSWKKHQIELLRLENAPESEKEHPRSIASIRRANTADVSEGDSVVEDMHSHPTSIASLFPREHDASKVHLITSWRAILGQEVVRGEHHNRNVIIRPLRSFHGCPIAASVSHPATMSNDFSKGPAHVPFKVELRNRLLESPVDFLISLEPKTYDLIGMKKQRFQLDPDGDVTLSLQAVISRPGMFDLQALQITVRQWNEDVTYQLSQQWLVRVRNPLPET